MELELERIEVVSKLTLNVELYGDRDNTHNIDLGSLTLKCEGREYILDVTQSYSTVDSGFTNIQCDLERDEDTFPDCKYDLTIMDLIAGDIDGTFYIESDLPIEGISLAVRYNQLTRMIDICQE